MMHLITGLKTALKLSYTPTGDFKALLSNHLFYDYSGFIVKFCLFCLLTVSSERFLFSGQIKGCGVSPLTLNFHRPPISSLLSKHTGSRPSSMQVLIQTRPELPAPTTATRRAMAERSSRDWCKDLEMCHVWKMKKEIKDKLTSSLVH